MNNHEDLVNNLVWLIRSRRIQLLVDLSKELNGQIQNDEQIVNALKSSRCVFEVLEWCSVEDAKNFLAFMKELNLNLDELKNTNLQTPFHAASLNAKPDEMITMMVENDFCAVETMHFVDKSNQNPVKYLLSEKSHCTDRLSIFKALVIFQNNGVKIEIQADNNEKSSPPTPETETTGVQEPQETTEQPENVSSTTEEQTKNEVEEAEPVEINEIEVESVESINTDPVVPVNAESVKPEVTQQLQLMLQQQLMNYYSQLQQSLQKSPQPSAIRPTTSSSIERPSVYNRRISSEQIELPDGRLCTRVPPRKWSKRDPEWELFQYECEFCPYFNDVRKYRRKAELVRHQALHFPEQARKFKCTICSYSATRNEYLKSHMANRHNIIQTPPREKKSQLLAIQSKAAELVEKVPITSPALPLLTNRSLLQAGSVGGISTPLRPSMVPIGKPQVVRISTLDKKAPLPVKNEPKIEKTVKIETIEAEEQSSSCLADYERDQIMPEELFTS